MFHKYPKTMHLPFSPGLQNDDRVIQSLDGFLGKNVVITEKMDGENASLYKTGYHARSLDSRHHPSRNWIKKFHGAIAHKIPEGWRVCGENMYAKHSVEYVDLESFFYGFSIWDETNTALNWDQTVMWFNELGMIPAPVLYRGKFELKTIIELACSLDIVKQEGFVVRVSDSIPFDRFHELVAKWVRPGHVQTDEHWMHSALVANKLRNQYG